MLKELKFMKIECTESDNLLWENYMEKIEKISEEIVCFFDLDKNFGEKVNVKIFSTLEEFRNFCLINKYALDKNGNVPDWLCGLTPNKNTFYTLTYEEYIKTKNHSNKTLEDYAYLLLHEFVHICHKRMKNNVLICKWFREGLAMTLSHQYQKQMDRFNGTLEEMIYSGSDYMDFYAMFQYVLINYGIDYIKKLLKNDELLKSETPRLYCETKEYYESLNFTR